MLPITPHLRPLNRLIVRARLNLLFQRLWPRLVGLFCLFAVGFMVLTSGLLHPLPYGVRLALLLGFAALSGASLVISAFGLWPSSKEAIAFIDEKHKGAPLASALDRPVAVGPVSDVLWNHHSAALLARIKTLHVPLPRSSLPLQDRFSLRFLIMLALIPFLIAFWGEGQAQLRRFLSENLQRSSALRLDLWVNPPAYTARAPLMLGSDQTDITLPKGSILALRSGAPLTAGFKAEGGLSEKEQGQDIRLKEWQINDDALFTLGPTTWRFTALPDHPPSVSFEGKAERNSAGQLAFRYNLNDDYGVVKLEGKLAIKRDTSHALVPPPEVIVALPIARVRSGTHPGTLDVGAHPFAGLEADFSLTAHDDIGQSGQSDAMTITLPQRHFNNAYAAFLIEQRQNLALDDRVKDFVMKTFDLIAIAPQATQMKPAPYLIIKSLASQLQKAQSKTQLRAVLDALYLAALELEDSDLEALQQDVDAAAEALKEAIERGASPDEVKRLAENLKRAIAAMTARRMQQQREAGQEPQKAPKGAKAISQRDIQKLIDRIEELNRQGAKEQAQRLTEQLQDMLKQLEEARKNGQMMMAKEGEDGEDAGSKLNDLARKQQQLRDETYRRNLLEQQRKHGRTPPQDGRDTPSDRQLGEQQKGLGDELDTLSNELGQNETGEGEAQINKGLSDAKRAMREAEEALKRGDRQGAMEAQNRALQGLKNGAEGLAKRNEGQNGRAEQGEGKGESRDPLGRPSGNRNSNQQGGTDATTNARAQRLLDELRRRLGQESRPQLERDYLERLLKGVVPQ